MTQVEIVRGFAEWRRIARALVLQGHDPEGVVWEDVRNRQMAIVSPGELLTPADHPNGPLRVPKAFVRLADVVSCHSDPQRWARLYRVLWRLTHGEKRLLDMITDDDVQALSAMAKAVRRDYHKMTAFVRFRATPDGDGQQWFVAWFEPDNYIVERVAPFFSARFSNMRWSILTPKGCAHWNDESLHFTPVSTSPPILQTSL